MKLLMRHLMIVMKLLVILALLVAMLALLTNIALAAGGEVPLPDLSRVMGIVLAFFADARVRALVGLIALDFLLGLAAALRCREFDWKKVADFYQTNVFPYLIGYFAFYIATNLIIDPTVLGDWANIVGEGAVTVAWAAILASLGNSIVANVKKLGLGQTG